jgi:hypothetical protein
MGVQPQEGKNKHIPVAHFPTLEEQVAHETLQ